MKLMMRLSILKNKAFLITMQRSANDKNSCLLSYTFLYNVRKGTKHSGYRCCLTELSKVEDGFITVMHYNSTDLFFFVNAREKVNIALYHREILADLGNQTS